MRTCHLVGMLVVFAMVLGGCSRDSVTASNCADNPDFTEAVIVEMPGAPDFDQLGELEDELYAELCNSGAGIFDGNLIGPETVDLFAYGRDANEVLDVIEPVLRRSPITLGATVRRQYADGSQTSRPLAELGPVPIIVQGGAANCPEWYFERDSGDFDEEVILVMADALESEPLALLEDELVGELCYTRAGVYDGHGVEPGPTELYFYGDNADSLYETLRPVLRSSPQFRGATAIKRFADGTEVRFDVG